MLTMSPPWPATNGGEIRAWHLLRLLARRFEVDLLPYRSPLAWSDAQRTRLGELAWLERGLDRFPPGRTFLRAKLAEASGRRHPVVTTYGSPPYTEQVRGLVAARGYAAVHADIAYLGQHVQGLPPGLPTVMATQNVEADIARQLAEVVPPHRRWLARRRAEALARYEARWLPRFDLVSAVSALDAARLGARYPALAGRVVAAPNGVDVAAYADLRPAPDGPTMVYVASLGYEPNRHAVEHLVADVLPRVAARIPEVRLLVVGGGAPAEDLARWARDPRVEVTGVVPDVRPYLARGSVGVVALRQGGGTRLKALEALAAGVPLVSTTLGQEGLDLVDGEHLLVADGADALADAAIAVLRDPALARRLAAAGRAEVARRFDWARTLAPHLEAVEALVARDAVARAAERGR